MFINNCISCSNKDSDIDVLRLREQEWKESALAYKKRVEELEKEIQLLKLDMSTAESLPSLS